GWGGKKGPSRARRPGGKKSGATPAEDDDEPLAQAESVVSHTTSRARASAALRFTRPSRRHVALQNVRVARLNSMVAAGEVQADPETLRSRNVDSRPGVMLQLTHLGRRGSSSTA